MASIIPIFRIFDYGKAVEFYMNWLGFKIDWEDKHDNAPIYMQISLDDIVLHLTEHHGDCCPGARVYIGKLKGLKIITDNFWKSNISLTGRALKKRPGTRKLYVWM